MRKTAPTRSPSTYARVMIHERQDGVFLFLYDCIDDGPCAADQWFMTLHEAEAECARMGIAPQDWTIIDDPPEGCQQDWIRPTKMRLGEDRAPRFEAVSPSGEAKLHRGGGAVSEGNSTPE